MKYYLDTSIWRDLYENRSDRFRPLGEWAFELFRLIRQNKDVVLYSDLVVKELLNNFDQEEIDKIFKIAMEENAFVKLNITDVQEKEARVLCRTLKIPANDCLHAILARDNNVTLVARDRHFEQLMFLANIKKPEELI